MNSMTVAAIAAPAGILVLWLLVKLIRLDNHWVRQAQRTRAMGHHELVETFEDARRIVVAQLRNPHGKISKADADGALETAVACMDRLEELDGKEFGEANKAKIRRALETRFRREADYWINGESGLDALGRDQEPSVFAAGREYGPFPR